MRKFIKAPVNCVFRTRRELYKRFMKKNTRSRSRLNYCIITFVLCRLFTGDLFAKVEHTHNQHINSSVKTSFSIRGIKYVLHHDGQPKRLLVLMHGCEQSGDDIFRLAHASEFLTKFHILVPNQNSRYNSSRCWNWFLKSNQSSKLFSEVDGLKLAIESSLKLKITKKHVTTLGISSGAAQLTNLYYNHPELIDQQILIAGPSYRGNRGVTNPNQNYDLYESNLLSSYEDIKPLFGKVNKKRTTTHLIHGNQDKVVAIEHNSQNVLQNLIFNSQCSSFDCITKKYHIQTKHYFDSVEITSFSSSKNQLYNYKYSYLGHAWPGGLAGGLFLAAQELDIVKKILLE